MLDQGDGVRRHLRPLSPHRIRCHPQVPKPRRIPVLRACDAASRRGGGTPPLPTRLLKGWGDELNLGEEKDVTSATTPITFSPRAAVVLRRVLVPSKPRSPDADAPPDGSDDKDHPVTKTRSPKREAASEVHEPTFPVQTAPEDTASTGPSRAPSGPCSDDDQAADGHDGHDGHEDEGAEVPTPLQAATIREEPIAFDEQGRPIIVRSVDEFGQTRHLVCNEDGKVHTFGERTVDSLLDSEEDRARNFVDALSHRDMRGLVHELGQRLLRSSQLYQQQQGVLELLCDSADYEFFGLPAECSEKDLDNAYRKMAKKMHPDKNGGTELAKKRFQHMKERYESLKAKRSAARGQGQGPTSPEEESHDSPRKDTTDPGRIEFDPFDRKSLDLTVWKMLGQLRMLKQGLKEISQQIGRQSTMQAARC